MAQTLLLTALLQLSAAPPAELPEVQRAVLAMGTRLELAVAANSREEALGASERALEAIEAVEARISTWREASELSRLNRSATGQAQPLSPELGAWLARASHWREQTARAFDPAVGPLVGAWDLRGSGRRPSPAALELARSAAGEASWSLDQLPRQITRQHPEARLEEGGFGKGAGLDAAREALEQAGVRSARLDLGGQVLVLGEREETYAVAHPDDRALPVIALDLSSGSLATSGNSERGLDLSDARLGHLLDPRTGSPAPDHGSMTVRATSALDADCLSTAAFVLGPDAALELVAGLEGVDLLVLERGDDGQLVARATRGFEDSLTPLTAGLPVRWFPPRPAPEGASTAHR